ncbi:MULTISPECIES: transposase [Rhizobium/Agrobacterium group]|uniref:transposase n=1 Tax=Allorhizobium ampelinum TaxID=3025782 RepID=UPI001F3C6310|nr:MULTISPECIES: transposase [Rhizobium/Agrobacterium group]
MAITMCLSLRVVYDQPLRQTQGMMRSIATLMGVGIAVPDFSTLSRRGKGQVLPPMRRSTASPGPCSSGGRQHGPEGLW